MQPGASRAYTITMPLVRGKGNRMRVTEQDFAERWRAVVRHVRDGAERMQATADDIPPELVLGADPGLRGLLARHVEAFADYAVALNCLRVLITECSHGMA